MIQRFEACMKGLFDAEPPLPTSIEQAQAWCCQLKQNFIDFLTDHPIHDCLALAETCRSSFVPRRVRIRRRNNIGQQCSRR